MDIENVSLTEVIAAARGQHASLVPESAGYLVLGVIRAMGGRPIALAAERVMLNTEGVVTLVAVRSAGPKLRASEAAQGLQRLLVTLLEVSQGKSPALRSVAESVEPRMARVMTGITRALIPLNRAAAKRALARLARETVRAKARGQLRPDDLYECDRAAAEVGQEEARAEVTQAERRGEQAPCQQSSDGDVRAPQRTTWDRLDTNIELATPSTPSLRPEAGGAPGDSHDHPLNDHIEVAAEIDISPVPPPAAQPAEEEGAETDVDDTVQVDRIIAVGRAASAELPAVFSGMDAPGVGASRGATERASRRDAPPREPLRASRITYPYGLGASPAVPDTSPAPGPTGGGDDTGRAAGSAPDHQASPSRASASQASPSRASTSQASPSRASASQAAHTPVLCEVASRSIAVVEPGTTGGDLPGMAFDETPTLEGGLLRDASLEARPNERSSKAEHDVVSQRKNDEERTEEPHPKPEPPAVCPKASPGRRRSRGASIGTAPRPSDSGGGFGPSEGRDVAGIASEVGPAPVTHEPAVAAEDQETAENDPLASEAALVERLMAERPARHATADAVDMLLERFGEREGSDSIVEAASSLGSFSLQLTPMPATASTDQRTLLSIEREVLAAAPARSTGAKRPARHAPRVSPEVTVGPGTTNEAMAMAPTPNAGHHEQAKDALSPGRFIPPSQRLEAKASPVEELSRPPHDVQPEQRRPEATKPAAQELAPQEPADEEACDEPGVSSLSPPMATLEESPDDRSVPPTSLQADGPRHGRRWGTAVASLLLSTSLGLGALAWKRPHLVERVREMAVTPSPAPAGTAACAADLQLRDLPRPHEVLLRLGETPLTRTLPTGVRLEAVALSPHHLPERILIPAEASWSDADTTPALSVGVALERGTAAHWPGAPPGEVGGVGAPGTISFTSEEVAAEMWLVVAAGEQEERTLTLSCDEAATLLVVNPEQPSQQRRLSIARELLETASRTGGAALSVRP